MKPEIVRDMDKSYLVMEEEQKNITGYQQKMVLHNEINGILSVELRQVDGLSRYYYDVTDRISMKEYFDKNKISSSEVKFIFEKLIQIVQDARSYMLDQESFILDADYIYMDMEGRHMFLCFYEDFHVSVREQLLKIAEYFMEQIDYKEERAVTTTYSIYKVLREDTCSFTKIKEVMEECNCKPEYSECEEQVYYPVMETEREEKTKKSLHLNLQNFICLTINIILIGVLYKSGRLTYTNSNQVNVKHVVVGILVLIVVNAMFQYVYANLRSRRKELISDAVFYESEDTIVLNSDKSAFMLKEERGKGQLTVLSFPFVIGASKNQAKGVIQFPGVSKRHAVIDKKNKVCTIMDLGSTNGTFLNGVKLETMVKEELKENDKITIANITYQFIKLS